MPRRGSPAPRSGAAPAPGAATPAPALGARKARALREALLAWYAAAARPLPWRRTRDPYAIWVSEAMLQQTRVETVEGYWSRFLERFPSASDLAAAPEEELLAAWSGLGYYRRARALQAAARVVVERHGGDFPDTREAALALPGVGPYTAGAVLSIAYGRPEPVVDGNVARVFARLFGLEDALGTRALEQALWRLARELVPDEHPGTWNQAVMELGATVCTPRAPACSRCPIARPCSAHRDGREAELPRPAPRRAPIDVRLEVLVVRRAERLLLARRPPGGRMAGLWECPTREILAAGGSRSGLFPAEHEPSGRLERGPGPALGELSHGITHHRIRATVAPGRLRGRAGEPLRWFEPAELVDVAATGMTRKVLSRWVR